MLSSVCAVVVEADDFDVTLLTQESSVVLETELCLLGYFERAVFAVQLPDDTSIGAVNLVDAACVARRYEVVAVRVLIDAVDVEVVPGIRAVEARPGLSRVDWKYRLYSTLEHPIQSFCITDLPSGEMQSRLAHSNSNLPVAISSSYVRISMTMP